MKKRVILFVFSLLILNFCVHFLSFSQEAKSPKYTTNVKLSLSGDDTLIEKVSSYLSRELRSLTDVIIVDENAEWELSVIAMELGLKSGYKTGVVISIVITQPFDKSIFNVFLQEVPKEYLDSYILDLTYDYLSSLSTLHNNWIRVGATDDLKNICEGIIADFDSRYLESDRKKFREAIKKLKEKKL